MQDLYFRNERLRYQFVTVLRNQIGAPYHWGANGPNRFDCSGLIVYAMHQIGFLPSDTDLSAHGLANRFQNKLRERSEPSKPGEVCFYGSEAVIDHAMVVLSSWGHGRVILIGARGGTRKTTTLDRAYADRAYVDVVHGDYWQERRKLILDPFVTG
jgi:cell wall-associated NlpC family hydrolase